MLAGLVDRFSDAAIAFVVAFGIGIVADAAIVSLVRGASERSHWAPGAKLASALRGLPTALGAILGAWLAARQLALAPEALATVRSVVEVAAIVVSTAFAARVAGSVTRAYVQREDSSVPSGTIFVNLVRGLVWIIGGITVLAALGVSIAPLVTTLGVSGLVIGLALQDTLGNLFSGIQVVLSKQIRTGDFVRLETGQEGFVHDVTWRNTTIKTLADDLVIVPNATLGKSLVTNFTSMEEQTTTWVELGVAYDSNLDAVERVTLDVAREVLNTAEGAVADFEPTLRFTEFGENGMKLRVSLRAQTYGDRFALRHEFIKRLHARYAEEGIVIPYPQRVVHQGAPVGEGRPAG